MKEEPFLRFWMPSASNMNYCAMVASSELERKMDRPQYFEDSISSLCTWLRNAIGKAAEDGYNGITIHSLSTTLNDDLKRLLFNYSDIFESVKTFITRFGYKVTDIKKLGFICYFDVSWEDDCLQEEEE